ncbi:hypothetical protein ACIQHU_39370 [Streptomyces tendae]|uniref:hypothetical protein n=1 Tax=Streptomyces tendae TaxID=1932 RepID=UPI0037F8D084
MDPGWAAIIAAIAAGVFGITGILAGITVGRRQTTDQADVEHQQWLRGQRQDAYVQLLDTWDQAVDALEQLAEDWTVIEVEMDAQGQIDDFQQTIQQRAERARQIMVKPMDRATLLGPESVDRAVARMDTAFDNAQAWLGQQANPAEAPQHWDQWGRLLTILHDGRQGFLEAAKETMGRSPRPGR